MVYVLWLWFMFYGPPFRGRDPQQSPVSFRIAAKDLEDQPYGADGSRRASKG